MSFIIRYIDHCCDSGAIEIRGQMQQLFLLVQLVICIGFRNDS